MKAWHRFARAVYKANRATRTVQAWGSGSPKRIAHLYERRMLYRLFAKFTNRLIHSPGGNS